ncbi:MAG: hypothetical protein M0036_04595, partial [Desulfobacteraceae bacterium]|nr:hypothetical protein [Desulfobacteraceae bacterium]
TGGYIYRGNRISGLFGDYIYGDFISGRIWRMIDAANGGRQTEMLLNTGLSISTFAQDRDGEIYIVDYGAGRIYRLAAADGP